MTSRLPHLTLYTRPGCHLCEQASQHLVELQFDFAEADVDTQAQWRAAYGDDVPVLCLGERVLMKGAFSRGRLSTLKLRLLREQAQVQD